MNNLLDNCSNYDLAIVVSLLVLLVGIILNYAAYGARFGTNLVLIGILGVLIADHMKAHSLDEEKQK